MKKNYARMIWLAVCSAVLLHPSSLVLAQPPSLINYQGRLLDGTNLVNGNVGLSLRLFNAASGGTKLYEDSNTVTVVDGLYATFIGDDPVDPSMITALNSPGVWVEVAVNGTTLVPREQIVSVGYALTTRGLRVTTNGISIHNPDINYYVVDADYATISGGHLNSIGTNSDYAVVGGGGGNAIHSFYSTIAGGRANEIASFSSAATIGGGDENSIGVASPFAVIAGGQQNSIDPDTSHAFIGGGLSNRVAAFSESATIAGGMNNSIEGGTHFSTIGGGTENTIMTSNYFATIAGGFWNDIGSNSLGSTISGGFFNKIGENNDQATIAGGSGNRILDGSLYDAAIGGGSQNEVRSNTWQSVIIGGYGNRISENSRYATILGGRENRIGPNATNALAAGRRAQANHQGSFVWADNTDADFASTASNQFLIRAGGGVGVNVNNPQAPLHVAGDAIIGQQTNAPRFGMAAVVLSSASGVLFQHPTAPLSLTWAHSIRSLTVTNGLAPNEYVDASIRLTEEPGASTHATADLDGGTTLSVTNSSGSGSAWHVIAVREDAAGPGFTFQGAGFNDGVSGLVTYWY